MTRNQLLAVGTAVLIAALRAALAGFGLPLGKC